MKHQHPTHPEPKDAQARRERPVIVCYPTQTLPQVDLAASAARRDGAKLVQQLSVPPRTAACIDVPAGHFARIVSVEGPQVGDLNIWNSHNLAERFYSGKTRALHGTHVSKGDSLWSSFPFMRPLAHITCDTLDWYGYDADGGSVHDVIGTRCDPYTGRLLSGTRLPLLLPFQPDAGRGGSL